MKHILSQLSGQTLLQIITNLDNNNMVGIYYEPCMELKEAVHSFKNWLMDESETSSAEIKENIINLIIDISKKGKLYLSALEESEVYDWAETHHFFVVEIEQLANKYAPFKWGASTGSGAAIMCAIDLCSEFTLMFYGIEWGEEIEFLDTLEEFIKYRIAGTQTAPLS